MANPRLNLERLITNNGPIQESIMRNLTGWDFRNLKLAGVRITVSREFQRRHQIPIRCNERDPQWPGRCDNTTETYDEIRACTGSPLWYLSRRAHIEKSLGDQKLQPCLLQGNPDNEPNTREYPIHKKACRSCRDFYRARELHDQLLAISELRMPLCKRHSLKQAKQFPLNACRCLDYVNDKWRCRRCYEETLYFLITRADLSRQSLANVRVPWSWPWAHLRSLWTSKTRICPIEGCFQKAWLSENRERMQLCLGCSSIIRV